MLITIDGPAGAGKSTVAKLLALRLSQSGETIYEYLDTGAMYRAVALAGLRDVVDWDVPGELERVAKSVEIDVFDSKTFLNGKDVTAVVRSPEITDKTRFAANNPAIRAVMVALQQRIGRRYVAQNKGLVTEGRDQGTVVFPDAACKFFVTASPEERARRRLHEMTKRGGYDQSSLDFAEILAKINERDLRDSSREVGPLCEPKDALRIVTDGMGIDEVVTAMLAAVQKLS